MVQVVQVVQVRGGTGWPQDQPGSWGIRKSSEVRLGFES